jgi:predicted DsbA family dithiol-disulfide isomerase
MQIDIISDVICPWCFIGKRRLERALALRPKLAAALSWRAFQLNPDMPANGIPRELYLSVRFGNARRVEEAHEAVSRAARAEGIDFAFGRIRRTPNTLRAHRLIRLAMLEGCAAKIVETLFQAFFHDGLDIGDIETLAIAAQCAGLDEMGVRHYLASEAGTVEVRAEEHRARLLGIQPCRTLSSIAAMRSPARRSRRCSCRCSTSPRGPETAPRRLGASCTPRLSLPTRKIRQKICGAHKKPSDIKYMV